MTKNSPLKNYKELTKKNKLSENFKLNLTTPKEVNSEKFREDLKKIIHENFLSKKLLKGYNETLNQIYLHKKMTCYICGELDDSYYQAFEDALNITKLEVPVIKLPSSYLNVVHETIANLQVKNKKKLPRKFFKTRLFGIKVDV